MTFPSLGLFILKQGILSDKTIEAVTTHHLNETVCLTVLTQAFGSIGATFLPMWTSSFHIPTSLSSLYFCFHLVGEPRRRNGAALAFRCMLVTDSPGVKITLLAFGSRIGLCAKVGSSRARLGEEAGEDWLDEGAEDDLCSSCRGECHPEDQDKLEGIVECFEMLAGKATRIGMYVRNQ